MRVDGKWDIVQSNGFRVAVDIGRPLDELTVFATHSGGGVHSIDPTTGLVRGTHIELTITGAMDRKGSTTGI